MPSPCHGCKYYTSDHRGEMRCSAAGTHEPTPGYGSFPIPKCVHDENLSNLFQPMSESAVVANANTLRIQQEKLDKLTHENATLRARLTDAGWKNQ